MTGSEGRLVFPGGKQEAKPFFKDMKKLQRDFAVEMSQVHKRVQRSAGKWFDLADTIVDTMIGGGPELAADMVWGLDYAVDDCFLLMNTVLRVMDQHGVAFYQPGGDGALSPDDFANRARSRVEQRHGEMLRQAEENQRRWGGP